MIPCEGAVALARRGCRIRASVTRLALICVCLGVLAVARVAAQSTPQNAATSMTAATAAFAGGGFQLLDILRQLRSDFPASPFVPDSLALSVKCALGMKDDYHTDFSSESS